MRPDWDEVWMEMAFQISRRAKCSRRQVGAVIVGPDQRHVAVGYAGPPAGYEVPEGDCRQFCPRAREAAPGDGYGSCVTVHAEVNALLHAGRDSCVDGTLYVTTPPCWDCAKIISNSGITTVVYRDTPGKQEHALPERSILFMEDSGLCVRQG